MIMIITLTLTFLVVLNFLLLAFSCNKTTTKQEVEKPYIIKQEQKRTVSTKQLAPSQLAPTGS